MTLSYLGCAAAGASWEVAAVEMGLDEKSIASLRSVHMERAHQILEDLQTKLSEIQKPSAYVSKACNMSIDAAGILQRALETDTWRERLDEQAKASLQSIDANSALSIMSEIRVKGDEVRNHSSYVVSTVKKRKAEGRAGLSAYPSYNFAMPVLHMKPVPGYAHAPPPPRVPRPVRTSPSPVRTTSSAEAISEEEKAAIDQVFDDFPGLLDEIDEKAMQRVYQMRTPDDAREALEALIAAGSDVRNKSAFLNRIVDKRLKQAADVYESERLLADEEDAVRAVEEKLDAWGDSLDERARSTLKELQAKFGAGSVVSVLEELTLKNDQGEIRNVSSFATTMARARLNGTAAPNVMQAVARSAQAEVAKQLEQWGGELDDKARATLEELQRYRGPSAVLEVLRELETKVAETDIRNKSSYIFTMARKRISALPGNAVVHAGPYVHPQASPRGVLPASATKRSAQGGGSGGGGSKRPRKDPLDPHAEILDQMDDRAREKVRSYPDQSRVEAVLAEMAAKGDIRNPSAFICRALK